MHSSLHSHAAGVDRVNAAYPDRDFRFRDGPPIQGPARPSQRRRPCRDFAEMRRAILDKYPEVAQPANPGYCADPTTHSWWPTVCTDVPIRRLFRTLTIDMEEVDLYERHETYGAELSDAEFMVQVIAAINLGSNYRSPFIHCSRSYKAAEAFVSSDGPCVSIVVEIDLVRWYQLTSPLLPVALSQRCILDFSTDLKWQAKFEG
jgi:hypothetical protein